MSAARDTLARMSDMLSACTQGQLPQSAMIRQWRQEAASLPLPEKFGLVLSDLLDRLEAGALFSEESCSFSQKDLLQGLHRWAGEAREQL